MNLVAFLLGVVLIVAGVVLLVVARRRRLTRLAHGEDPGKNIAAGIGASLLGVGVLSVARSF